MFAFQRTNHHLNIPESIPTIKKKQSPNFPITSQKQWRNITLSWPSSTKTAAFFPYHNNQFNIAKANISPKKIKIPQLDSSIHTIQGELFLDHHPPIIIDQPIQSSPLITICISILGAFIGGLLLNIMPCVLPILGIKALQLQQHPSTSKGKDALRYALGVGLALFTLYAILLALKWGGTTLGWGFQLQSPIIIQCLIVLFIIMMAINLNLIQVPLPKWAAKPSNNMLLSGILTTIIATPCTAPFLGSALSVALFQSPLVGLLIFLGLSIGLALPMSLIIYNPTHRQWLPKSGHWNQTIKAWLNLGFIVTIGWLMWVLKSQISQPALFAFFSSIITLFLIVIFRSTAHKKQPLIILATTLIIGLLPLININKAADWAPYTPDLIATLESNKTPYFIDVTAKWCITCQTNKLTVLNSTKTNALFEEKGIKRIRADWTNDNPRITTLLKTHGKASIPTYIYFDGQQHIVFGDILTQKKLKAHLK